MTIRCIAAGTLALFSTAVLAASQAPLPVLTATSSQTTTVLVGCLYREIQVTGSRGDYDDHILADATTPATGGSAPAWSRPGRNGHRADDRQYVQSREGK
jgi:hypothetical protein